MKAKFLLPHLENYQHPDQFGKWLGYKLLKANTKNNSVEVGLKIGKKHLSPAGKVHGGVISGFFDYACGAAVFTMLQPKDLCATIELKVSYFRPVMLGDELKACVRVVFRGKSFCSLQGFLFARSTSRKISSKDPIAMVSATFYLGTKNGSNS